MTAKQAISSDVKIDSITGIIRVDCVIIGKLVKRDGVAFLQFKDRDEMRSNCRKTCLVEIELGMFAEIINSVELQE